MIYLGFKILHWFMHASFECVRTKVRTVGYVTAANAYNQFSRADFTYACLSALLFHGPSAELWLLRW